MGRKRDIKYDEAYLLYQNGLSLNEVAEELGVTRQCVFKAFKKRNFNLRTQPQRPVQFYDGRKFTLANTGYFRLTSEDRQLMHRYVWEAEIGAIPKGWDIHHINEYKTDNRIENLECLLKSEHTRKYSPNNNQYTKGRKRDSYRIV